MKEIITESSDFFWKFKSSAGKVRSMLYVAFDLNYISKEEFDKCYFKAVNIRKQISNFRKYLRNYLIKEKTKNLIIFILSLNKVLCIN